MFMLNKKNIQSNIFIMNKILHLTCKNKYTLDNNNIYLESLNKFKELYSDFEIKIYDDNDIYNIFKIYFPLFLADIKQIQIGAVLADIFRYLILYLEGGIYADLDCIPLKNINSLFNFERYYHGNDNNQFFIYPNGINLIDNRWDFYSNPCNNCYYEGDEEASVRRFKCMGHQIKNDWNTILCYEFNNDWIIDKHNIPSSWLYNDISICQWFIISKPNQKIFLKTVLYCLSNLDNILNLNKNDPNYHYNVLNLTGPLAFTRIVMNNLSNDIYILPSDFFCCGSGDQVPVTKNSYIIHKFNHSWK